MPVSLPLVSRSVRTLRNVHFLVWHDIVPDGKKQVWFDTTVSEFVAQLNRLKRTGAATISLPDAVAHLRGVAMAPKKSVVLCFDDNTAGICELGVPILQKRRMPFVVSAHTAYVGVATGKRHNTWEDLRSMAVAGGTIVSQTHTHPADLTRLSDAALRREFTASRALMARNLRTPMPFLTYPAGKWNNHVARIARECGYEIGLTEDHGASETSPHLLAVRRWSTHRRFDEIVRVLRETSR